MLCDDSTGAEAGAPIACSSLSTILLQSVSLIVTNWMFSLKVMRMLVFLVVVTGSSAAPVGGSCIGTAPNDACAEDGRLPRVPKRRRLDLMISTCRFECYVQRDDQRGYAGDLLVGVPEQQPGDQLPRGQPEPGRGAGLGVSHSSDANV